jgi:hypothetical protein
MLSKGTMNRLLVLISIFLISCNQNEQSYTDSMQKSSKVNHAQELIDNGFLKYADTARLDSLRLQISRSFNIYDEDNFKIIHIDAEELAEFSFDFFLPNLNRILEKRDIKLYAQKANANENSLDVLINDDTIQLYTQKDLENNTFRDIASRNFFKKVNQILKSKNSDEQFYLLYGGNDLHVLLLTENQFLVIADYYKDEEKERPYKP